MKLVDLVGVHVETSTGAPIVLLREHDAPHRLVPIFVGGAEAASIEMALSGQASPRPLSHDLMVDLVHGLEGRVESVRVTDFVDGAFVASVTVTGPTGARDLQARPSDAIAVAVRLEVPLFVSDAILDEAAAVVHQQVEEEVIDETVAQFRTFLDDLEPSDFEAGD